MSKLDPINSWYSQLSNTYTAEQRKNWYSATAEAYNHARPRYPKTIINRVLALTNLPNHSIILEIGSGPGIATKEFANYGFSMVCIEPSLAACQLAQQNCRDYPLVNILNTTFEEWQLQPQQFDAVLAATSFHWVSREIGFPKAAKALKANGYLILLWNTSPQPSYEIHQRLQPIYQIHAPTLAEYESKTCHEQNLRQFKTQIIDSGLFQGLVYEQQVCEVAYSIDDYLALLSTLSPYIKLDEKQREALFVALKIELKSIYSGRMDLSYLSAFHIAQKR